MHVFNDKIRNNSVKHCDRDLIFFTKMTDRMSSRTWYTKLVLPTYGPFRYVSTH